MVDAVSDGGPQDGNGPPTAGERMSTAEPSGAAISRRAATARWFHALAWHWVAIVGASVLALAFFAKVGEDVFQHESGSFDDAVRGWMLAHQVPALWTVFLVITYVGSAFVMVPFALVVAAWLWRGPHRRIAAVVVTAPAIADGVFNAIKSVFRRVRPIGAERLHLATYAFPSGHATTSTAVLVTIAYVLAREGMVSRRLAMALGIGGPLLVGVSRVYLDVHWTTDVLGGWALGLLVAALSAALYERIRSRVLASPATPSTVVLQ